VEHLLNEGFESLRPFLDAKQVDPFHVVAGTAFGHEPKLSYAWHVAAEPTEEQGEAEEAQWDDGDWSLGSGVFVVSNQNPKEGITWPKCDWLRQEVEGFLATLPRVQGAESYQLVQQVQAGLAEIMSRFDVDALLAPSRLPKWFAPEKEVQLHSGPFTPWRPTLQDFGTVSQRILVSDAQRRVVHYFHRSTNLAAGEGQPPGIAAWGSFVVDWPAEASSPPLCACL